jgi:hypothetical protein
MMIAYLRHATRPSIQASLSGAAVVISLLIVLIASAQQPKNAAPAKAHPAPARGKLAEDVYKNIKSMRGQPANQLIPTMQFMSAALGVDCEFCHDVKAFDKDTKDEKRTAREMIAMQEGINKKSFKGEQEISCNSCHHGAQHPAAIPALPELNAAIAEPVHEHGAHKIPQLSSPAEYLDDFLKAAGGEAALAKISSRSEHGSVSFGSGSAARFESYTRASGQRSTIIELPQGKAYAIYNGHAGWLAYPGHHDRGMSAGEGEAARVEADVEFPVNFKQRYSKFRADHPENIDGKPMKVLLASRPGQPPVRLYFDESSHLLVRVVYYVETPLGRNPTRIDITGYADAEGIRTPNKWIVTRPASRATYTVEGADNGTPIEDSRFEPPPASEASVR